jgi:hypothetical protein
MGPRLAAVGIALALVACGDDGGGAPDARPTGTARVTVAARPRLRSRRAPAARVTLWLVDAGDCVQLSSRNPGVDLAW